jgi:hypothetical protein
MKNLLAQVNEERLSPYMKNLLSQVDEERLSP